MATIGRTTPLFPASGHERPKAREETLLLGQPIKKIENNNYYYYNDVVVRPSVLQCDGKKSENSKNKINNNEKKWLFVRSSVCRL